MPDDDDDDAPDTADANDGMLELPPAARADSLHDDDDPDDEDDGIVTGTDETG